MIEWRYELERGFMGENVTFSVFYKSERSPLFRIDIKGFSDIDGYVQDCFDDMDLDTHNHLKIIGVDLV